MSFKKIILLLLLLTAFSQASSVKLKKSGDLKLTNSFKSDLGYEIKYPNCAKVTYSEVYDEKKEIESLDSISLEEKKKGSCSNVENEGFLSIRKLSEDGSSLKIEDKLIEMEKNSKFNKEHGTRTLFFKRNYSNSVSFVEVSEGSAKEIIWELTTLCKNSLFQFRFMTEVNKAADPTIKASIINGDPVIPEFYLKIIDSFKCLKK